jgi:glycosyltransferase involved in cell wall biosynthesis
MSVGKAIIASNLPVLAEVLDDGVNALLCEPDDIQQWLLALERFKDTTTRNCIARYAKKTFEQHSWGARASAVLEDCRNLKVS